MQQKQSQQLSHNEAKQPVQVCAGSRQFTKSMAINALKYKTFCDILAFISRKSEAQAALSTSSLNRQMTASYRQRVRDWQRRQCVRDEEERSIQRCVHHHQTSLQSPRNTDAATSEQTLALVPLLCITINTTILSTTTRLLFVHFFHLHVYIFYISVQLTVV